MLLPILQSKIFSYFEFFFFFAYTKVEENTSRYASSVRLISLPKLLGNTRRLALCPKFILDTNINNAFNITY